MDQIKTYGFVLNEKTSAVVYSFIQWVGVTVLITLLTLLTACAGQPPKELVSKAELAIQQAMNSKAEQFAPSELSKARNHMEQADRAIEKRDYKDARRYVESALVEAQLAEVKSEAHIAQSNVSELQQNIREMRQQTQSQESTP